MAEPLANQSFYDPLPRCIEATWPEVRERMAATGCSVRQDETGFQEIEVFPDVWVPLIVKDEP